MARTLLVTALLMFPSLDAFAVQKITVEQLRQTVLALHGKSDRKFAGRLADLELTERLSRAELDLLSRNLPGKKSKGALLILAHASVFKSAAPSEMLPEAALSAQAQTDLLTHAAQVAVAESDDVPNFVAIRETEHFQDARMYPFSKRIEYYTPGAFHFIEHQADDVSLYAGGTEVGEQVDKDQDRRIGKQHPMGGMTIWGYQTTWGEITWRIPNLSPNGLKPTGAFGPWLQAVTGDVPGAQREWAYWERTGSNRLAVFRFRIPQEDSHYTIEYDFPQELENPFVSHELRKLIASPGYHGEIAIDPESGKVARIVVICDFAAGDAMLKAGMALEYGPVELGGTRYQLPVRGVSRSSVSINTHEYHLYYGEVAGDQMDHFTVTSLDALTFSEYRVNKPRIRIVPLKSLDRRVK